MVYIKYGAPNASEEHATIAKGIRPIEQGGGETTFFPYEKWQYAYLEGVGSDINLEFVDPAGTGEYRLTWNPNDKDALPRVPGTGSTVYEQIGLADKENREGPRTTMTRQNIFERIQRYVDVRKNPGGKPQQLSLALGAVSDHPYQKWLDQEALYIISPEERAAFRRLQYDDERQTFIEQFWLRRDPTPETSRNEAMEQHYQRIAYANERFGTADAAGWSTDRGAIYIVFGLPDDQVTLGGSARTAAGSPGEVWQIIAWNYSRLDGVGEKISVKFDVEVAGPHPNLWRFASGTVEKPAPNTTAYRTFAQLQARQ